MILVLIGRTNEPKEGEMYIELEPVISIIAGIIILVLPKMLNYTIGIYLLLVGVLGLIH